MPSRTLEFEGCVNFRDLGGYRTTDGRMVAWRTLFRADGLNKLTDADLAQLTDLGLATVIDLRTLDEAEQRGSFPVDRVAVTYVGLPLTDVLPGHRGPPGLEGSRLRGHPLRGHGVRGRPGAHLGHRRPGHG